LRLAGALSTDRGQRLEVGRVPGERRARRRLLDAQRTIDRRVEDLPIGAREQVRQGPVGDRRDAESDLGKGGAQRLREALRAVDSPRARLAAREHGARHVDDHERLGVRSLPQRACSLDDRLGSGETDERSCRDQCEDGHDERSPGRFREREAAPHRPGTPARDQEQDEREEDSERQDRSGRSEQGHAAQYPLPGWPAPAPCEPEPPGLGF
jgi:hypothetical protein